MGESKHTPGPRTVSEWEEQLRGGRIFVARVLAGDVVVARFECSAYDPEAIEATRADALLDAAAPEMYKAHEAHLRDLNVAMELLHEGRTAEAASLIETCLKRSLAATNKADGRDSGEGR